MAGCPIYNGGILDMELSKINTGWKLVILKVYALDHQWQLGVQWLSGRVLDLRPSGCGFEPQWRHCVLSLSKNINPSSTQEDLSLNN